MSPLRRVPVCWLFAANNLGYLWVKKFNSSYVCPILLTSCPIWLLTMLTLFLLLLQFIPLYLYCVSAFVVYCLINLWTILCFHKYIQCYIILSQTLSSSMSCAYTTFISLFQLVVCTILLYFAALASFIVFLCDRRIHVQVYWNLRKYIQWYILLYNTLPSLMSSVYTIFISLFQLVVCTVYCGSSYFTALASFIVFLCLCIHDKFTEFCVSTFNISQFWVSTFNGTY